MKKIEKKAKELLVKIKQLEERNELEKIDKCLAKLSIDELRELLNEKTTEERYDAILGKVGL